jgi:hypothetical protein
MDDSLSENDVAHNAEQYEVLPKGCYSKILANVRPKPVNQRISSNAPYLRPEFNDKGHCTRWVVAGYIDHRSP